MAGSDLTHVAAMYERLFPAGVTTIGLNGVEHVSWAEYIYRHGPEEAREVFIAAQRPRPAGVHSAYRGADGIRAMPLRAFTQAEIGGVSMVGLPRRNPDHWLTLRSLPRLTWWRRLWRWARARSARRGRAAVRASARLLP